jgi:hypothetical protein
VCRHADHAVTRKILDATHSLSAIPSSIKGATFRKYTLSTAHYIGRRE